MLKSAEEYIENELLTGKTDYELRLSQNEVDILKKEYPSASFEKLSEKCNDGKIWFNIIIK